MLSTRIAKKNDFHKNSRKKNNQMKWETRDVDQSCAFKKQENLRTNEHISIVKLGCCYGIGHSACSEGKEMRRAWRGVGGEKLKGSNTFFFSVEQIASAPPCVC